MELKLELQHSDIFALWYCLKEMIKEGKAPEGSEETLTKFKEAAKKQLGYTLE